MFAFTNDIFLLLDTATITIYRVLYVMFVFTDDIFLLLHSATITIYRV